jgi:pimeloyl-ACP methyl ester carboxylesterase
VTVARVGLVAVLAALVLAAPAGAQSPPVLSPVHHVSVNGATLGYRTTGSGPPLVMIMGFGGTMAEWDPALIANLATQHTVVLFDNRGMGNSQPSPVRGLTVARMADDAAGLIDALGLGQPDVLGWSMGGNIAELLVLRHPDKVHRLVLAGTDPGGPHAVQPTNRRAVQVLQDPNASTSALVSVIFPTTRAGKAAGSAYVARIGKWFKGFGAKAFDTPAASVSAQIRGDGPLWYCRGCGAYDGLPTIKAPTLVTDGTLDLLEPPANSRIIARRIPGAKLTLYRGAGHAHLFQFNGRYAGDVNGFLAAP